MDTQSDILIIGSGAGGGTVASALAPLCAEGARIAVLEWGPHFKDEEFTGGELEMAEKLFFGPLGPCLPRPLDRGAAALGRALERARPDDGRPRAADAAPQG